MRLPPTAKHLALVSGFLLACGCAPTDGGAGTTGSAGGGASGTAGAGTAGTAGTGAAGTSGAAGTTGAAGSTAGAAGTSGAAGSTTGAAGTPAPRAAHRGRRDDRRRRHHRRCRQGRHHRRAGPPALLAGAAPPAPAGRGGTTGTAGRGGTTGTAGTGGGGVIIPPTPLDCGAMGTAVENHGPPANRLNYVIVGDGYSQADLAAGGTLDKHIMAAMTKRFSDAGRAAVPALSKLHQHLRAPDPVHRDLRLEHVRLLRQRFEPPRELQHVGRQQRNQRQPAGQLRGRLARRDVNGPAGGTPAGRQ